MNIHTMLKQKKKVAKVVIARGTAPGETDGGDEQRASPMHNLCPRCGYNMGIYWASQYCSRRCVYGYDSEEDVSKENV